MTTSLTSPYAITRYDTFSVILQECPRAGELLAEYGLHCATCFMNDQDTVENGASMHGMSEVEMLDMLHEINTQLEKEWREANQQPPVQHPLADTAIEKDNVPRRKTAQGN